LNTTTYGKIVRKTWQYEVADFIFPSFQRTSTYILKLPSIKHYRDPLLTKYKLPTPNYPKNCPLSGKHEEKRWIPLNTNAIENVFLVSRIASGVSENAGVKKAY